MEMPLPHPCPECGTTGSLNVRTMFAAKPFGSLSLAGVQVKTEARKVAEVTCSHCGASRRGRLDGVEVAPDGTTITAGHFVSEEG